MELIFQSIPIYASRSTYGKLHQNQKEDIKNEITNDIHIFGLRFVALFRPLSWFLLNHRPLFVRRLFISNQCEHIAI